MTGIVQAIDEPARRSPGMGAPPDLHQPFFHAHRHSLIENETFALPVFVSEFLLIGGDPAVKLKDAVESFPLEKGGRPSRKGAASAIHQDRFLLQVP